MSEQVALENHLLRFLSLPLPLAGELREAARPEHPKQTHPTGMRARVEIRERIYEHLAAFQ